MTMLQYNVQVGANGSIVIPATPFAFGEEVEVVLRVPNPAEILPKDKTAEERRAAFDDFMTSWKGCMKGVSHMTAKEIRAERLEKKYGQHGGEK